MFPRASRFVDPGTPGSPVSSSPNKRGSATPKFRTPQKARSVVDLRRPHTPEQQNILSRIGTPISRTEGDCEKDTDRPALIGNENDIVERKLRDLQKQKVELEHQSHAKTKQAELLEHQLRQREDKIRILTIDNSTLSGKLVALEDKLKAERKKESAQASQIAIMNARIKDLEKTCAKLQAGMEQSRHTKENEPPSRGTPNKNATVHETPSHLRDQIAKLEKQQRHHNATLRDEQRKHALEKRNLQQQIASLRNVPGNEQKRLTDTLSEERSRWEAEMESLRKMLAEATGSTSMIHKRSEGRGSEEMSNSMDDIHTHDTMSEFPSGPNQNPFASFITEDGNGADRRLSGFSIMSEAFSYKTDDDNISTCTLENVSLAIPSLHRAIRGSTTPPSAGHLKYSKNDLLLIRKKTSSDTWVAEMSGKLGLVLAKDMEDCVSEGRKFEDASMDTLPTATPTVA
ncbi:hypothetical protein DFJ77DRAFT_8834 [Powellomyces hirtus]|nr:hypothetical protein DFJ77DRAFT_8834 [Powellomyces hirtus]